jgi:hypothetical protein
VIGPAGAYLYAPHKWGIVQVHLTNPDNEPAVMLATIYFVNEPTLQYGRRIWVPPHARVRTWHPVLIPAEVSDGGKRAPYRTLVTNVGHDREVLIRSDAGYLESDGALQVSKSPVTGIIEGRDRSTEKEDIVAIDLLVAAQAAELLNRQNTILVDQVFAPGEESLQALDQLFMVDGRVAEDDAGLDAIRRWLFGGGHLWVMLDRVDPRVLEMILGDEFSCEVIDRIGLTNFQIESAEPGGSREPPQEHDRPVEFVRAAVTGVNVAYTVQGWPAAFWKPCGEGLLLVTTLGPQGWMRPRTKADNQAPPPMVDRTGGAPDAMRLDTPQPPPQPPEKTEDTKGSGKFVLQKAMQGLSAKFFSPRPAPLLPPAALEPLAQEYVGYSIPPRWLIALLLSGVSLVVAGLASFLWRRARPEALGWAGPGLAIAVSVVVVFLGRHHRQLVPATVASIQFVEPVPGTDDVRIHGGVGLFSPEGGTAKIAGEKGGWLMPEMAGLEGNVRRMVWTDVDDWRWENLSELAVSRGATFLAPTHVTERLAARATFGPAGIEGHLQMGVRRIATDAVLATRDGRIGVEVRGDGAFAARPDDVFAAGQFVAGALWTDEQNRRARILKRLLTSSQRPDYPAAPELLFWTDPWDVGFEYDASRKQLGSALVAVPLEWERPPPGTRATIPGPLLAYRATVGPDGFEHSGLWDHRKHTWQEKSGLSATWLRFQVPTVLLPAEVERARLTLQVTGAIGKIEIAGAREKEAVPIKTWIDPWGQLSLEITQPDLLPISADGGLLLRVSGGDPDRPELAQPDPENSLKRNYWRIEQLVLELSVAIAKEPVAVGQAAEVK